MSKIASITQAQDADAQYIINKIKRADECDAAIECSKAEAHAARVEAGLRLAEVQKRLSRKSNAPEKDVSGALGFRAWLEENDIPETTARRLIELATATDEQREAKKAAERTRKNAANAAKKLATNNSVCREAGVPEGGTRVTIQNEAATILGFREAKTEEQAAELEVVTKGVIAARRNTLADTRAEIETLPETAKQKLARIEATLVAQLTAQFYNRVNAAAAKRVPELVAELEAERIENRHEMARWKHRRDGIKSQLTEEEYRLIRQTIASDRYPEEFRPKLDKIAAIINRFGAYVEAWSDGRPAFKL